MTTSFLSWITTKRAGYDPIVDEDGIEIEGSSSADDVVPGVVARMKAVVSAESSSSSSSYFSSFTHRSRRHVQSLVAAIAFALLAKAVVFKVLVAPADHRGGHSSAGPPSSDDRGVVGGRIIGDGGGDDIVATTPPSKTDVDDENVALFYDGQLVDHLRPHTSGVWSHRYYESTEHFGGPGHPILLVVGGEGAINNGILYPFVTGILAKRYGAAVIQPEHRFYGPYPPVPYDDVDANTLLEIFTPEQAMMDMLRLVTVHLRKPGMILDGCSSDRSSKDYCPLITVGASYPGFLSALFRIAHPDVVDAAYAASAPLLMYAQVPDNTRYYDIVTSAADRASPGCAHSVKTTLSEIERAIMDSPTLDDAAVAVGICSGELLPKSLRRRGGGGYRQKRGLVDALALMVVYGFANYDMENYPPGPNTSMYKICRTFQDPELDSVETMKAYFRSQLLEQWEDANGCGMSTVHCTREQGEAYLRGAYQGRECYDMRPELDDDVPDAYEEEYDGRKYDDMTMWDFQTCTNVIFLAGQSNSSMFLESEATYEDLARDCADSFGRDVVPRPTELNDRWHFAPGFDLVNVANASRILFTNGLQDMWSGGSYLEDLSDSILAINFVDGAHHSDLTHTSLEYDEVHDTDEIREGKERIAEILGKWIDEIRAGMVN